MRPFYPMLLLVGACQGPADAPTEFCNYEHAEPIPRGETFEESLVLRFVLLRDHATGALVESRMQWTSPVPLGIQEEYPNASSLDLYELRWKRTDEGYEWETPGDGPNFWDCTLVNDEGHLDCDVTHQDGHVEAVEFHTRTFGRQGPEILQDDPPCVSVVESEEV